MRATQGYIWDVWNAGGPFVGNKRSHGRVTVEPDWELRVEQAPGGYTRGPVRWFQRADNSQAEVEVPNIEMIVINRSVDTDANTCTITMGNQQMDPIGVSSSPKELGNPGYFSFSRGQNAEATARWGHTTNAWANVLGPNALIRTYQGYGGIGLTIRQAQVAGNLIQTGIWLVDEVRISTSGKLELHCRDMAKLLIEQQLYPPLVPSTFYPPRYCRYYQYYVNYPQVSYGTAAGGTKRILGIETDNQGDAYWLVGSDGGVFTYGANAFYGSGEGNAAGNPVVGMAKNSTGDGYWIVQEGGEVTAFGAAQTTDDVVGPTSPIKGIESAGTTTGYYVFSSDGGVFAFGGAPYFGNAVGQGHNGIIAMAVKPDRTGYWLVDSNGGVYSFGGANYYGNAPAGLASPITAMSSSKTGNGYILVGRDGGVFTFGDATYHGGMAGTTLADPISDIVLRPDGSYWLVGEDGGVFSFGGAPFYGSLPASNVNTGSTPGNYTDYVDIIRDLLLWSGWWLNDGGANAYVFGNLESTGIFALECIPEDEFDKRPVIDAINKVKEIVGYIFWVDEEGGARFQSPNWWSPGNFLETGQSTAFIPTIDEAVNMTNYSLSSSDRSLRSQIIISSNLPTANRESTVTTVYTPSTSSGLKGIVKPAMWVNGLFTNAAEQQVMAELIALHVWFQQRLVSLTCAANPMIQIDDQVRIYERQTDETYIHYVRTVATTHDLITGAYTMDLTTHWLGDSNSWAINTGSPRTSLGTAVSRGAI